MKLGNANEKSGIISKLLSINIKTEYEKALFTRHSFYFDVIF
jgi:hypothetical protein